LGLNNSFGSLPGLGAPINYADFANVNLTIPGISQPLSPYSPFSFDPTPSYLNPSIATAPYDDGIRNVSIATDWNYRDPVYEAITNAPIWDAFKSTANRFQESFRGATGMSPGEPYKISATPSPIQAGLNEFGGGIGTGTGGIIGGAAGLASYVGGSGLEILVGPNVYKYNGTDLGMSRNASYVENVNTVGPPIVANAATLGAYGFVEGGVNYYETGDPRQFQQGAFNFAASTLGARQALNAPTPAAAVPQSRYTTLRQAAEFLRDEARVASRSARRDVIESFGPDLRVVEFEGQAFQYSGAGGTYSRYLSPRIVGHPIDDLALPPSNPAILLQEYQVLRTRTLMGEVAPQDWGGGLLPGGAQQIYVPSRSALVPGNIVPMH
jgi:hypothetical protein